MKAFQRAEAGRAVQCSSGFAGSGDTIVTQKVSISTVTPVYAGESYLAELVNQLDEIRQKWRRENYPIQLNESIFVDDESIDNSAQLLKNMENSYDWIRVLTLSRNFGQHPATTVGILHTSGDWIVTLDEDLQHKPALIESMLVRAITSRYDIIYAQPNEQVHQSLFRDISSNVFKCIVGILIRNPVVNHFNSFRLIRGSIARSAAAVVSHDGYFDIVLTWFTDRFGSIKLDLRDERYIESKKSGYNFSKLLSHARRMLVSSQTKFMRLGAPVGIGVIGLSAVYALRVIWQQLYMPESIGVRGWSSLMVALLFFCGLIIFALGIAFEYLRVMMLHFQGKPTYFVIDRSSDEILDAFFQGRKP